MQKCFDRTVEEGPEGNQVSHHLAADWIVETGDFPIGET